MTDSLIIKVFYTTRLRKTIINKFESKLDRYPNIRLYLETRYDNFFNYRETLFRIYNKLESPKVCKYCGVPIQYTIISDYCCNEHKILGRKIEVEKTNLERYGVKNVAQVKEIKARSTANTDYQKRNEHSKETMLERYGVDNPGKLQSTIQASHTKEAIEKQNESREKTCNKRYGCSNVMQSKIAKDSYKRTCNKRYGKDNYFQTEEFKSKVNWTANVEKQHETKRKNGTFNISKEETKCKELLLQYYPDIICQYKSPEYNFCCDFYIPSINTYIEYNGMWTHGGHPIDLSNSKDIEKLNHWKKLAEHSKYYANAVENWSKRDVLKRETAKANNLNYIEFWNLKDVYNWLGITYNVSNELFIEYDKALFDNELEYYNTHKGALNLTYKSSDIIKHYQQNVFYKTEKELWSDISVRAKLIENRIEYTGKTVEELTIEDILSGFKKSGIHYGYSSFNPLWFKWFIEHYNIKTCYDPCGGWGHRLLGSLQLDNYIYNDLSTETVENIKQICNDFNLKYVSIYNNDASNFIPNEDYEAMFTCPPYFNLEVYPCGEFETYEQYSKLIDGIFDAFYNKPSCKVLGIVIREDCLPDKYRELSLVPKCLTVNRKNYLSNSTKKNKEYLYIFKK